ncbi:MFS transporter [Massilia norwichensis]|uniref:MFS transporter n=1 Tax=Massilia norwichensis TaxID=1442366 RepID=A0ABT2A150_9BURK|nr:MFS transporter [Massilia norwichensis]MCS0587906.1 MFS transporter [Massilia norwichensis]
MHSAAAEKDETAPQRGMHLALGAMVACQVGLHACVQGVRLAAPLNVLRLGCSAWSVGLVMTMFALFPALLALPAGRLADRRGYHLPVRIAAVCSLGGTLLAGAQQNLFTLCAAAALCGAGSGFGMIAIQRSASRLARSDSERLQVFSWIALAPALAGLFGPMLAGLLIDHAGFSAAFLALALLPAATLLAAQAVPREAPRPVPEPGGRKSSAWDLLRLPSLRRLLFISWVVSLSWDVHGFALPLLGVERGLNASALGLVLAAYAAASMTVRLLMPLVVGRLSRRALLCGALVLTCAVFAAYPLFLSAWAMAACAAILGIGLGLVQPAILATLHEVTPPERQGEGLALRSMALHASMAVMPLLFGAIGAGIGAAALFWLMSAALGLGSLQARTIHPDRGS